MNAPLIIFKSTKPMACVRNGQSKTRLALTTVDAIYNGNRNNGTALLQVMSILASTKYLNGSKKA